MLIGQQIDVLVHKTIRRLTTDTDQIAAWQAELQHIRDQVQDLGQSWLPSLHFVDALLALLAGNPPDLAADNPHYKHLQDVLKAVADYQWRTEIIHQTVAVMTSVPERRAAWQQRIAEDIRAAQASGGTPRLRLLQAVYTLLDGGTPDLAADDPEYETLQRLQRRLRDLAIGKRISPNALQKFERRTCQALAGDDSEREAWRQQVIHMQNRAQRGQHDADAAYFGALLLILDGAQPQDLDDHVYGHELKALLKAVDEQRVMPAIQDLISASNREAALAVYNEQRVLLDLPVVEALFEDSIANSYDPQMRAVIQERLNMLRDLKGESGAADDDDNDDDTLPMRSQVFKEDTLSATLTEADTAVVLPHDDLAAPEADLDAQVDQLPVSLRLEYHDIVRLARIAHVADDPEQLAQHVKALTHEQYTRLYFIMDGQRTARETLVKRIPDLDGADEDLIEEITAISRLEQVWQRVENLFDEQKAQRDPLRGIRNMVVESVETPQMQKIVKLLKTGDWQARRAMVAADSVTFLDGNMDTAFARISTHSDDPATANGLAELRLFLRRARRFSLDDATFVHETLRIGAADLPAQHEIVLMETASALRQGDYHAARQRMQSLIVDSVGDYRLPVLRGFGQQLYEAGLYEAALQALQAVCHDAAEDDLHAPDVATACLLRGECLARLWRLPEAIQVYSDMIDKLPPSALLYRNRAHVFIRARKLTEARADLQEAILLDGHEDSPHLWHRRAQIAIVEGDGLRALGMLDEVRSRDKQFIVGDVQMMAYWLLGQLDVARETATRFLQDQNDGQKAAFQRELQALIADYPHLPSLDEIGLAVLLAG